MRFTLQDDQLRPPRDFEALWTPLLRQLSDLSADHAVWKNLEAGLTGGGDVDFVAPRASWPVLEKVFLAWTLEQGIGPTIVCRHMPDTMFLLAVDRSEHDFLQLDVRSRLTFRGSTIFVPGDIPEAFQLDNEGLRSLRPGAEGLLKLVISGTGPGGRQKRKTLDKEKVAELMSSDPEGISYAATLCGPAGRAAVSGASAVVIGEWSRIFMVSVEAWFLAKGLGEPATVWRRVKARRAKKSCEVIQTSIAESRRIPGDVDEWLLRAERDHEVLSGAPNCKESE